jgi:hypothetical protein
MTDKVLNPFEIEEIPSKNDLAARLWEQDILDISEYVRGVILDFMEDVCGNYLRGIDLVNAWISATLENHETIFRDCEFPRTAKGHPLFPIIIEEMELESSIKQAALAFYEVADSNYNPKPF